MTTTTSLPVSDYLKYANLQMAAEAFLNEDGIKSYGGTDLARALAVGNRHASKFTELQATEFAAQWEVVDQKANTSTGFSGTLFKNKATGELVMSFRSTEFIDDSARDNQATNALEISKFGFAFDLVFGGADNDVVAGYQGNDILNGDAGDDLLYGDYLSRLSTALVDGITGLSKGQTGLDGSQHGNDLLNGGAGDDRFYGGGRDDVLVGGTGNDQLMGDDAAHAACSANDSVFNKRIAA